MPEAVFSDGHSITYESHGQGTPVLLLHPANATRRAWSDLGWIGALTRRGHRAVTIDSRGFGESDSVDHPDHLRLGTSSLDIIAVLDVLRIGSAHLCAFSLGAAQALRFALDHPARVDSLVLGGLAVGPLAQVGLYLSGTAEAARTQALTEIQSALRKATGASRSYFVAVQALLSTIPLHPVTPSGIDVPILGVAGATDPYNPAGLYRALLSGGAAIDIAIIPHAGHGSCFTHPQFRELATAFVTEKAGRPTPLSPPVVKR